MDRSEWTIVRDVDRKLRFITKQCAQIEKHDEEIKVIQKNLADVQELLADYQAFLAFRRKLNRALAWVVVVVLTAVITSVVNSQVTTLIAGRDDYPLPVIVSTDVWATRVV